ncbi:MAG: CYTH domain-containing protein [Lentisphaerae bacterium]|jgi:adenylate cyclase|nr:CYTH domain-containing protein [Lentisphaerota bacterium]
MAIETELKFLTTSEEWRKLASSKVEITQGYFNQADGYNVRVRIIDNSTAKLTIKSKRLNTGISKFEFEYDIPLIDGMLMIKIFCQNRIIKKTRYFVKHNDHTWEIDEFHGDNDGLVLAELELKSIDEPYEKPSWIGEDVSLLLQYTNAVLAVNPFTSWDIQTP